jgi:hypothetical protein
LSKPVAILGDGDWLPLAEHARSRGISERKLRRQLIALHQRLGGGVLRSYNEAGTKVRKWFFNPAAVKAGLERDPDEAEISLGEHLLRIEDSEKKIEALRQSLNSVKAKVKALERRVVS